MHIHLIRLHDLQLHLKILSFCILLVVRLFLFNQNLLELEYKDNHKKIIYEWTDLSQKDINGFEE